MDLRERFPPVSTTGAGDKMVQWRRRLWFVPNLMQSAERNRKSEQTGCTPRDVLHFSGRRIKTLPPLCERGFNFHVSAGRAGTVILASGKARMHARAHM